MRPKPRSLTRRPGERKLKGKAEPTPLWQALRVIAGRGGALKSGGLEPPSSGATASFGS